MTHILTTKQASFVALMSKGAEQAARGFELLAARDDAPVFFDAIKAKGLLAPSQNPAPEPIPDKSGYVRIPYWRALDYLEALATLSGKKNDLALASQVLEIVSAVSLARDENGEPIDNYHTTRKFAAILGLVPTEALSDKILELVPNWLRSKYDRSLAASAISAGVMARLLDSHDSKELQRANILLSYCTDFKSTGGSEKTSLEPLVEEFWLKDLFSKHAKAFGEKTGRTSAEILVGRLRQFLGDDTSGYRSALYRSAIEDHEQNSNYGSPEAVYIVALRDILLAWADTPSFVALTNYLTELLYDEISVLRRIAIHVVDEHFDQFRGLIEPFNATLLNSAQRHELYRLLDRHFVEFSEEGKKSIFAAIRNLPVSSGRRSAMRKAYTQRDWLSAIVGKNYSPADKLFASINTRKGMGPMSSHPDFLSYHESSSGPDPSPFSDETILAAAIDGTLLTKISDFKETHTWGAPSLEGLFAALTSVVAKHPDAFMDHLPDLTSASAPTIHAIIGGLRRCLNVKNTPPISVTTDQIWSALLEFFEQVLNSSAFWTPESPATGSMIARRTWVLSTMADILSEGTRSDDTAYPPRLLSGGWRVIQILLSRCPQISEVEPDIVSQVINTARGRAMDAAVNHALRVCRLASKEDGDHAQAWTKLQPTFNTQLSLAKGGNFEFSVTMGQYIANFDYLSPTWLEKNFGKIFDQSSLLNFRAATAGLAYATLTKRVYGLLVKHSVLFSALDLPLRRQQETQRFVEFICLALLWGDEQLTSPLVEKLFEPDREAELNLAIEWFWSVRSAKSTETQRAMVRQFWSKTLVWASKKRVSAEAVLGRLSRLAHFIEDLDDQSFELLAQVVPYSGVDFNFHDVVEQISRLAPSNYARASELVGLLISRTKPIYDMENAFASLLKTLAANGQKNSVLIYVNDLMSILPKMTPLYNEVLQLAD